MVTEDGPDVVCLQELPVWSLGRLGRWSGMAAVGAVARRPSLGPLPVTPELGRRLTELHPGLVRSAFAGQANAILARPRVLETHELALNPLEFRRRHREGLNVVERLAWARERRVCQAVRLEGVLVANLHATRYRRPAELELVRAAAFVDGLARPGEPVVLAGDFNVFSVRLEAWGFHGGGHRVDHVVARGLAVSGLAAWPGERRRRGGALLSDHAPVDATVS